MSNGSAEATNPPTEIAIAIELVRVVRPVIDAANRGPQAFARLLDDMGVSDQVIDQDAEKVFDTLEDDVVGDGEDIVKSITTLVNDVDSVTDIEGLDELDEVDWEAVAEAVDLADFKEIGESAVRIYRTVEALSNIQVQDPNVENLADAFLDYLVIDYLETYHGDVHALFSITGVIVQKGADEPDEFKPGEIGGAITDPVGTGKEVIQWGVEGERLQALALLTAVQRAMLSHNIAASRVPVTEPDAKNITDGTILDSLQSESLTGWGQQLILPIVGRTSESGDHVELGLKFVPVPPDNVDSEVLPGLAVLVYGNLEGGDTQRLDDQWEVGIESSGSLANRGVRFQPRVGAEPNVEFLNLEGGSSGARDQFVMTASLRYVGDVGSVDRDLIDISIGRVTVKDIGFEVTTAYEGDEFELRVAANVVGELSIEARGGFLEKVIPEPISYDFNTTVGWSSKSGFFIQNGGTLEASIPTDVDLGFLKIGETHFGISPTLDGEDGGAPAIPVAVGTSPHLNLGFLKANVRRLGLKFNLRFPEDEEGNLGRADLQLGFNPPNGIGLAVDAGPVTGGGQLNFYPDENRYSGTLSLQIGNIGLNAIGLLKTELPAGRDGYSLLILITADLPPVQLGFGFVLTGIGGLLGINRQAKMNELGATVRTGSLSSVLFPENVIQNSQQIITDLRTIFPPRADRHVVGPMAELGWGTPVLLQMQIGVILEIPTWRIAIAGIFQLDLPDEEVALIDLNLAVVGVIDIPNERIAIDASLFDSRVVQWTVSGDMAMRLNWGDDSRFLLSVGGFHPRYESPPKFPELDRVKVEMSPPNGNPRMGMKGYLAVTPNTFQVGAKFYLHGEFGPATVDGKLGFDALFEFDPFRFIIDFIAKVSVGIKGRGLTLKLDGTLKGPGPFHLKGRIGIEILFFEITVGIDLTFGESKKQESLPASDVMGELTQALGRPSNWSGQLPPAGASVVNIRQPDVDEEKGESEEVLVHPLGGINVRQTVVPLGFRIELYGNATPATYDRFEISDVEVDGSPLSRGRTVKEKFAPAKYREMSDSEKLDSPAFVKRQAGIQAGGNLLYYPGRNGGGSGGEFDDRTITKLEYETSVIDAEEDHYAVSLASLGSFGARRPEAARFGLPQEKLGMLNDWTAAGAAFRERQGFADVGSEVYGVRGGTVIGERDGPGERIVDVEPGVDTNVFEPTEVESVVDDGVVTLADLQADGDVVILGDRADVRGFEGVALEEVRRTQFEQEVETEEAMLSADGGLTNFGSRTEQGEL